MVPIKHIIYESGVSQIFKLIVPEGNFAGTYEIKMPKGWNDIDSVVSINEELFNVEAFILGDSEKLVFSEFTDKQTFDLIRNVHREQGGDGRIIFKWIAVKDGVEYDLLSENFEINLNKKKEDYDKTMMKSEVELIKSESQNKLYTRYDTTVNLFEEKDLDESTISPVDKFEIGFKKGNSLVSNFYVYDISQANFVSNAQGIQNGVVFFCFKRSDDYQFGDNNNESAGRRTNSFQNTWQDYMGPFLATNISLYEVKAKIANMKVASNDPFKLWAIIEGSAPVFLKDCTQEANTYYIDIDYQEFTIGGLVPGQNLTFQFQAYNSITSMLSLKQDTTIEITANIEVPLVRTYGIRLLSAINQLAKNYTSGGLTTISNILGENGTYYNTSVTTGIYLRGLPPVFLSQKLKTSMKAILDDGAAKLMALGYDVLGDKMVVEDINYFFKDLKVYDLSEKQYYTSDFLIENDSDITYNNLSFGTKKYSTNKRFDIQNFNTTVEVSTPIKTFKKKFDKQTDLIIDADKIQELVEDKSSATNDNDDDLVLIDMVSLTGAWDEGVFESCQHLEDGGKLLLKCGSTPFDTTMLMVGKTIEIMEGLNTGNWEVLEIDGINMKVNKTSGIQSGVNDTRIRYQIDSLIKNRTNEGFSDYGNTIRNVASTTNIRHNPKYHLARWWQFFGSGLRKKLNTDLLKVTNYKNNSAATVNINSSDMANELQGQIVVGESETLARMRDYQQTFFNGERIEITYGKITFEEFFNIYNNWKFGEGNDRMKSRGYLPCNTPYGIYDVYPFGSEAFRHNKKTNSLTIKGKIKGKSVESPVLLSVIQININTVSLTWDYVQEYINPDINIQCSFDAENWQSVHTAYNVRTTTFSNDIFNGIMTGTTVYFRVIVSTGDYYHKVSNSLPVVWQYNDWVINEFSRNENTNCGYSYLSLEIRGTVNLEIKWTYTDEPGGGKYSVIDADTNEVISSFNSAYGVGGSNEDTSVLSLSNDTKYLNIQLKNSDKMDTGIVLNCSSGNMISLVNAYLLIEVKDLATGLITEFNLMADTPKKYRQRPNNPPTEIP
jgi:hypothetical protein